MLEYFWSIFEVFKNIFLYDFKHWLNPVRTESGRNRTESDPIISKNRMIRMSIIPKIRITRTPRPIRRLDQK